jgi:hypothetical protein
MVRCQDSTKRNQVAINYGRWYPFQPQKKDLPEDLLVRYEIIQAIDLTSNSNARDEEE